MQIRGCSFVGERKFPFQKVDNRASIVFTWNDLKTLYNHKNFDEISMKTSMKLWWKTSIKHQWSFNEKWRKAPFQKVEIMASIISTISEKLISKSTILPSLINNLEGKPSRNKHYVMTSINLFCFQPSLRPLTVCWWPGGSSSPAKIGVKKYH